MNGVITVAVISVANSCAFGSTRTMQAMAERGMAPKQLAYVDKKGRPVICIIIQLAFGLLAFIGESADSGKVFDWLLSLSALSFFFVWGSICLAHIRFRAAWKLQGYSLEQIPYRPAFGVYGSWIGFALNCLCLIATFYNALYVSFHTYIYIYTRNRYILSLQSSTDKNKNSHRRTPNPTPRCSSRATWLPSSSSVFTCSGRFTLGNGAFMCHWPTSTSCLEPAWRSRLTSPRRSGLGRTFPSG